MSTQWTLDYSDHHELYLELFEEGKIYLKLNRAEFEARPDCVTVAMPLALWRHLRSVDVVSDDWWEWEGDDRAETSPGGQA